MPTTILTVSPDGKSQYTTIQSAIAAAETGSPTHAVIIQIAAGTYREVLYVQREKRFLKLVGAGPDKTIVTYDLYAGLPGLDSKPIGTFRTPTMQVDADDFTAENMTFQNTAGAVGQALALRIDGDRDAFHNCKFTGWQDTIFDNRGRHLYQNCDISGCVDFIFGGGISFFDHCQIHCLGAGYITAASTPQEVPYGFVFDHCTIDSNSLASDSASASTTTKSYLGRPWRDYASVLFMNTQMSDVIPPEGWHDWNKEHRSQTARFAEYQSTGPGGNPSGRVPWSHQLTDAQAAAVTISSVLSGADGWIPTNNFTTP